jgi:hypothetical protein
VPARDHSGDRDPQKHITKEGEEMLRKLLVGSAHYILGPFGSDSDLRRHAEKIASRGGKNAKKRAVVAVARKLSVLLHSLWMSGEVYEPLRNAHRAGGQAAQRNYRNMRSRSSEAKEEVEVMIPDTASLERDVGLLCVRSLRISGIRRLRNANLVHPLGGSETAPKIAAPS